MNDATPASSGDISIRVRYNECDPMGVAHHTAYPVWFEIGRTELLRSSGLAYRDLEADGVFLAVVDLRVRYRAPARYDDVITLTTTIARVTRARSALTRICGAGGPTTVASSGSRALIRGGHR